MMLRLQRDDAAASGRKFRKLRFQMIADTLGDLKTNKKASGRNKDLADLENLPE